MLRAVIARCFFGGLSLLLLINPYVAMSQSILVPSLELEGSLLDNETDSSKESGSITRISPGAKYQTSSSKTDISIIYSLNALYYNNLPQENDVDHSLSLNSSFNHDANRWRSYITGAVKQSNISLDGIQILDPSIQSDNTREFRTLGAGTGLNGKWGDSINYHYSLNTDYADFEGSEDSNSVGADFGLNSRRSQRKFGWNASMTSRRASTAGDDQQIDTVIVGLNYRFNRQYSVFLTQSESNTESTERILNDTNSIVGFHWVPDKNTSIRLGAGERGDDTTYTLDTLVKTRRTTFSASYDETITTTRVLLIDQATIDQEVLSPTSLTLSITPVLVKNGRVSINTRGKKSALTLALFKQTIDQFDIVGDEDVIDGVSISFNRSLSANSSYQIVVSRQESQTTQENIIDDASLSYSRQMSRRSTLSGVFRKTKQTSDVIANEYDQDLIRFRWSTSF